MKRIFKYENDVSDFIEIETYCDAKFLKAKVNDEGDKITTWFLIDDEKTKQIYQIRVYGTGHSVENNEDRYLETVCSDYLVWHLFFNARL